MVAHVTGSTAATLDRLPRWARLVRAPNPGPMTLDGTNTWLLDTGSGVLVVDPGPLDEEHLRRISGYGEVAGVLVTHGHHDHVEGLDRFRELAGGPPLLTEGGGYAGLTVEVLPTPGHTADSVCLIVSDGTETAVLTGDSILGRGTTVVAWPDGDLGDYLATLRSLTRYTGLPALPGHGPALADCAAAAGYYLAHRLARLEQVRQALAGGATTPGEVVDVVYADVDPVLRGAAEWTVRAQLAYLSGGRGEGGDRRSDDTGGESGAGAAGLDRL